MSNVGQAALIVVGTVVGAYFGYPQLGFVLGSLAGSALFPTQLAPGPRIQDNRTTTSVVGGPISLLLGGTANVAGTVIWLAPYVEHQTEVSQKGGPQQLTYSYTQSIAIGLAERVDDDAPDSIGGIGGISRIWENGAIVYDIRPQQKANAFLGTIDETDVQYANRLTASAAYAETFTLYLGDELQEPDPTMEAVLGVGETPSFRGLAYIVFPNRLLQIAQGLRHPNFQFEIYQSGTGNCVSTPLQSTEVLYPWAGGSERNPMNPLNSNLYEILDFDNNYPGHATYVFSTTYPSEDDMLGVAIGIGYPASLQFLAYAYTSAGNQEVIQSGGTIITDHIGGTPDPDQIAVYYNFEQPAQGFFSQLQKSDGLIGIPVADTPLAEWREPSALIRNSGVMSPAPPLVSPFLSVIGADGSHYWLFRLADVAGKVTRSPGAPLPPCAGLTPSDAVPGYAVRSDGRLVKCNPWVRTADPSITTKVLQTFFGTTPNCRYPLNPCLLVTDPNYSNATFWTTAYLAAVAAGAMAPGKTYNVDYPIEQNFYYAVEEVICEGAGFGSSIGAIITAVCKRSGLAPSQIDVTDMNAIQVDGYAVSTICSGASMLAPLRSIGFFDAVETHAQLHFPARGKPSVATFTTDDFGAYDASNSSTGADGASTCPPSITTTRSQEEDLPRSIRFHYIASSRDYEDAEQDSPFRLATRAVNDVDITVPVCLSDTQAAQCASVLWADAWAARSAYELSVDQSWLPLDVADCIDVPVDGVLERMRIANDSNASGILRKLSCVKDDDGAYISFAVGAPPPASVPQQLSFIGATTYEFLDLPCLQDADSDPGFYVACQRSGGKWKGATFYKSIDGGLSFSVMFSLVAETTAGTIDTAIVPSEAFVWDTSTVITVNLPSSIYSFESVTDDAVLAGANAAAMGADGRWEIVQFATAVQVSPTRWHLSRLLRGRRGTEHVLGSSRAGDAFVLLKAGSLGRVVLGVSEIGAARVYRGTSIGASFSSGLTETFTGHGQALVCFSPVDPVAERLTGGDLLIRWTRRSRLGRTLMSGVDIPLGEATEAYSIDILEEASPSSPPTVLRTLASSTSSVLYSLAHQETDFGSPLPATLKVAIYQLSAITGRGTPAIATLTVT